MRRNLPPRAAAVALAVLLALASVPPVVAVGPSGANAGHQSVGAASPSGSSGAAVATDPVVEVRRIVEQRGEPADEVYVTLQYDVPSMVSKLRMRGVPDAAPPRAAVVDSEGFEDEGNGSWLWDDGPARPSVTVRYTLPEDRLTRDDRGTAGEDWAFLALPSASHRYWYTGAEPEFAYDTRVRGEGVGTDAFAYLGEYEHYRAEADRQTVHLYVPARADMAEDPETVLGYLVDASERLDVGGRDEHVHGFAVPSEGRELTPAGGTRGANSFYVDAGARVGGDEAWVHEYVHTRQRFRADPDAAWLTEGSASYYGIVLRAHADDWTEDRLYTRVHGRQSGTLTDPNSWSRLTPYVEGRKFLAHLNLRLYEATDGEATITDVMRDLNTGGERVTHDRFVDTVGEYDAGAARWTDETLRSGEPLDAPRDPAAYVFHGSRPDRDGLNLSRERALGTSPFSTDTDGDGLTDDREVELGTDPTASDTDGDGLDDRTERRETGTDPTNPDADGDGVPDGRDDCPTEPGDGPRGCEATPTATQTDAAGGDGPPTVGSPSTDAANPVGPAPVAAVAVVALLAARRARAS